MADTSNIDLVGLIERVAPVRFGEPVGTGSKRTQKAGCPFCAQGTDRFAVFVGESPQHYHCGVNRGAGCGAHGDAISFLREYSGMSYQEACEELEIDPGSYASPRKPVAGSEQDDKAPNATWQKNAVALCHDAMDYLWSGTPAANNALAYLRKERGLIDATIKKAKLGFIVRARSEDRAAWGLPEDDDKKLYIPRGWCIPWIIDRNMWRVDIRRVDRDLQQASDAGKKVGKYHRLSGSGGGLYGADRIQAGYPLVVAESPLDALSGAQTSKLAVWVATGSTSGSRSAKWTDAMALASPVLVAFDQDENGAGSQAFKHWKASMKASRILPWEHDINEMLTHGMDIDAWLADGLEIATLLSEAVAIPLASQAQNNAAQNEQDMSDIAAQPVEPPIKEPPGYQDRPTCLSCGVQLVDDLSMFHSIEDKANALYGHIFCISCWQAGHHEPCGQYQPVASATISQSEHIAALSTGCSVRIIPAGMSAGEYIEHWYATQREQRAQTAPPQDETPQAGYWRRTEAYLRSTGYYEHKALQDIALAERVATYHASLLLPRVSSERIDQPEPKPTQAEAPQTELSDASRLAAYQKHLLRAKKKQRLFLTRPLVGSNGYYEHSEAIVAVAHALSTGGLSREAALDELHFREHGEYRAMR